MTAKRLYHTIAMNLQGGSQKRAKYLKKKEDIRNDWGKNEFLLIHGLSQFDGIFNLDAFDFRGF